MVQNTLIKRVLVCVVFAVAIVGAFGLGWSGLQWHTTAKPAEARPHPIDVGFAQFMSIHHQQAIAMAQLMLDGRPTPLRPLAQNIAYAQLMELGEMQGWLRVWRQPLKPPSNSMTWMLASDQPPGPELKQYLIECERSPDGMPGLATLADLELIRKLEGVERDKHFLKLMLAHHDGGIPMARFASQHAKNKVVRDRAAAILLEQTQEMHRIQRTIAAVAQHQSAP